MVRRSGEVLRRITSSTSRPGSRAGYKDGHSADGYEIQIGAQLVRASKAIDQVGLWRQHNPRAELGKRGEHAPV
jgi:hypothetical protein